MTSTRLSAESPRFDRLLVGEPDRSVGRLVLDVIGLRREDVEVVLGVVLLVAVLVVNHLAVLQWAAELLRHYNSVDRLLAYFWIVNGVCGFVSASARHGAEPAPTLLFVGWPEIEGRSTPFAGGVSAGLPRHGVARLRAPSTLARCATRFADRHKNQPSTRWFSPHCLAPAQGSLFELAGKNGGAR